MDAVVMVGMAGGALVFLLLLVGCLNVWPAADFLDCGNYPISGQ